MPEQQITLTIDEEGAITAKTSGFNGESCLNALEDLLRETQVIDVKKTHEYDQQQIIKDLKTIKVGSLK